MTTGAPRGCGRILPRGVFGGAISALLSGHGDGLRVSEHADHDAGPARAEGQVSRSAGADAARWPGRDPEGSR